jgi:protoporphyrinogen/coproporphyrinogen III oxidase
MDYDIIVAGGGISGMSFAHFAAAEGYRTLVLEGQPAPGGCMHSERLTGGFWFEMGAHTCYNSYQALLRIIEQRGLVPSILKRAKVPFRLLTDGQVRPITKELRILELLLSAPRLLTARKMGSTVRDYYAKLVGRHNYDRVFGPLFAAVPSQPADGFPADMLFKTRPRRKDIPRSYTLAGGLQTVIDSIARDSRVEVRCSASAAEVKRTPGGISVQSDTGERFEAPCAALAVPPLSAVRLLSRDFQPAAKALARIGASGILTVGVVVRRDATALEPVAGIIPLDGRFFSMVSRDTVPDPDWRGFAFHFRTGVCREDALREICALLRVDRPALEHVVERESVLASPALGHGAILSDLGRALEGAPVLVTGNYFGGLAIEDCVLRSCSEAARVKSLIPRPR